VGVCMGLGVPRAYRTVSAVRSPMVLGRDPERLLNPRYLCHSIHSMHNIDEGKKKRRGNPEEREKEK